MIYIDLKLYWFRTIIYFKLPDDIPGAHRIFDATGLDGHSLEQGSSGRFVLPENRPGSVSALGPDYSPSSCPPAVQQHHKTVAFF